MKRYFYFTLLLLLPIMAVADELCLISIKANGVETNYAISSVQKITLDTESADSPSFVVNRKDGKEDGGAKLLKFGQAEPTSVQDVEAANVNVNVYTQGKTIFVEADEECNITFWNMAGQQLGDCVRASKCECTISLAGTYLVVAGGQQFKIQVQ
ncbi:MAG: hypothetical protein MJ003_00805 [Paludibacteraceae bacterium]|nr:hypothetical protein [Paludibacteraceae bacterium]